MESPWVIAGTVIAAIQLVVAIVALGRRNRTK